MAHPKGKTAKARKRKRRSHQALTPPTLRRCPDCGAAILPHRVCPNCFKYRGVQYKFIREKKKKGK
ncbi:MAG: 50S ribosomal protein L32 [Planctomycetota bacterium]|nr:MAG: 50S ribosomal protein L32 [Planctomycetota bacterium]